MCKRWVVTEAIEAPCFKRYRIEWRAQATGFRGHGNWFPSDQKSVLENRVKDMNEKYVGSIFHWVQPDSARYAVNN